MSGPCFRARKRALMWGASGLMGYKLAVRLCMYGVRNKSAVLISLRWWDGLLWHRIPGDGQLALLQLPGDQRLVWSGVQMCGGAEGVAANGSKDPNTPTISSQQAIENHMEQYCSQ